MLIQDVHWRDVHCCVVFSVFTEMDVSCVILKTAKTPRHSFTKQKIVTVSPVFSYFVIISCWNNLWFNYFLLSRNKTNIFFLVNYLKGVYMTSQMTANPNFFRKKTSWVDTVHWPAVILIPNYQPFHIPWHSL